MKLKLGELNARMLCQYTSFAEVVGSIFGKSEEDGSGLKKGEYNDLAQAPSFDAAIAGINAALNFG